MANAKRAAPRRATGGMTSAAKPKTPSGKATAGTGKVKASATAVNITKRAPCKRKRSASDTGDDQEERDADDKDSQDHQDQDSDNQDSDNQDYQDCLDSENDRGEYVKDNVGRSKARAGIFGEEFYGIEDDYDDEDDSHIPPTAEQRRRNGRQVGRDLIMWQRKKFWNKQITTTFCTPLPFFLSFSPSFASHLRHSEPHRKVFTTSIVFSFLSSLLTFPIIPLLFLD
jgi:hypothetical protein